MFDEKKESTRKISLSKSVQRAQELLGQLDTIVIRLEERINAIGTREPWLVKLSYDLAELCNELYEQLERCNKYVD